MPRAPRACPGDNYTCPELITSGKYCPTHTVHWRGERTASSRITVTNDWKKLAPKILDRDGHQCQIQYPNICTGYADTVDKIIPAVQRPDLALDPTNLRAACRACNEHKGRTTDRRRT
ncbi:HNH endonuclease [Mycolicibacterium neoaurum]|uniref:HNH endonuclease n=1 Tax=Mycolicibacterium neoaurum TaxID=1795 RepID=UPI00056D7CDD|nr:HNH endonuclease [Mycolicibacterium neoaurum]SDC25967.1 HNH endonuclease [Mycolicibacterium neoaurum]